MEKARYQKYVKLLHQFLSRGMSAAEFEKQYLSVFKNESSGMKMAEYAVLEQLFTAVDAYCADPELRSDEDLDESQLREVADKSLNALLEMDYLAEHAK